MRKRRVLVLANQSLLMSGVLSVLQECPGIDLVTAGGDAVELERRILRLAPDVVVMESPEADEPGGVSIGNLLRENPRATLVTLRVDRPDMEVFRSDRIRGATLERLLSVVGGAQRKARRALASRIQLANGEEERR